MRDPYYTNSGDCVVNMNVDPFYPSPLSQFYRRQTPFMGQPDFRVYELNKRLQQRTEVRPHSLMTAGMLCRAVLLCVMSCMSGVYVLYVCTWW